LHGSSTNDNKKENNKILTHQTHPNPAQIDPDAHNKAHAATTASTQYKTVAQIVFVTTYAANAAANAAGVQNFAVGYKNVCNAYVRIRWSKEWRIVCTVVL
jgi:hypothetical protein